MLHTFIRHSSSRFILSDPTASWSEINDYWLQRILQLLTELVFHPISPGSYGRETKHVVLEQYDHPSHTIERVGGGNGASAREDMFPLLPREVCLPARSIGSN
jgi:hypothetical protein